MHIETQNEARFEAVDIQPMESGKSSSMTPNEVFGLPEIPPAAHEFAALLQFSPSYELVDWLTKRLHHTSEMLA